MFDHTSYICLYTESVKYRKRERDRGTNCGSGDCFCHFLDIVVNFVACNQVVFISFFVVFFYAIFVGATRKNIYIYCCVMPHQLKNMGGWQNVCLFVCMYICCLISLKMSLFSANGIVKNQFFFYFHFEI